MFKNNSAMLKYYQDTATDRGIYQMLKDETDHKEVTIAKLETGYLVDGCHAFSDLNEVFNFVDDLFESGTLSRKPAKNGWIQWHGGDCPVDPETKVHLRFRDGEETFYDDRRAKAWFWGHNGMSDDIIAYRVVSK